MWSVFFRNMNSAIEILVLPEDNHTHNIVCGTRSYHFYVVWYIGDLALILPCTWLSSMYQYYLVTV